jgi:hypothetical protein
MHWIFAHNRKGEKIAINLAAYRLIERTRLEDDTPVTILFANGLAFDLKQGGLVDQNLVVLDTPEELFAAPLIKSGDRIRREDQPNAPAEITIPGHKVIARKARKDNGAIRRNSVR